MWSQDIDWGGGWGGLLYLSVFAHCSAPGLALSRWLWVGQFCHAVPTMVYLVQFPSRVLGNQLLQAAPVGPRHLLGNATAPLQIQLIHLLAYVVPQHGVVTPNLLLEC